MTETAPTQRPWGRRPARLRVAGVWMVAAVALLFAPAQPALASSAVPQCFDSELSTVSQAFDTAAPPGSPMRQEGDLKRAVDSALPGVVVSRALIEIADSYGYRWDCTTQSFVPPAWATTSTSATTTSSTTTTTTTRGTATTTITWPAVLSSNVKITPPPTLPAPATTTTTRTAPGSTGSALTEAAPTPSTTEPAVPTDGATIDVPAAEGEALAVALPLAPPPPRPEGDAGRTAAGLVALVSVIGAGGGVLLGRRHQVPTPSPES